MKTISTVGMPAAEKMKFFGNTVGDFGNIHIRGHHIKYFEDKIESDKEASSCNLSTAPNYYAWLCLISEYVFGLMRYFCLKQNDFDCDTISFQYNTIVSGFCEKYRELNLAKGTSLDELYSIVVKILYLRHSLIHNGFPNLLPAGCDSLKSKRLPRLSKDLSSDIKFNADEAKEIVSWYSKPQNFKQARDEFHQVIDATLKGSNYSIGF